MSASLPHYAKVMIHLPATAEELSEATGIAVKGMRVMLRRLWTAGLVYPGAFVPRGPHNNKTALWMVGAGESVLRGKRMQPRSLQVAFRSMWDDLQTGATVKEMAEAAGVRQETIGRALKAFKPYVHIGAWARDSRGAPLAVWRYGDKPDKRKPPRAPKYRPDTPTIRQRQMQAASVWSFAQAAA